jgi:hypothetical protein
VAASLQLEVLLARRKESLRSFCDLEIETHYVAVEVAKGLKSKLCQFDIGGIDQSRLCGLLGERAAAA